MFNSFVVYCLISSVRVSLLWLSEDSRVKTAAEDTVDDKVSFCFAFGVGANSPSARGAGGRVISAPPGPASRATNPSERHADLISQALCVRSVAQAWLPGLTGACRMAALGGAPRGRRPEPSSSPTSSQHSAVRDAGRESRKASAQVLRSPGAAAGASFCPFHWLAFRCPIRPSSELANCVCLA